MRFGVTTEKKKNKLDAKSKKIKKENQEKNEPTSNQ